MTGKREVKIMPSLMTTSLCWRTHSAQTNVKIPVQKHFMSHFGIGSKWVCDFPLSKSDTHFDPIPKLRITSICALCWAY